MIRHFLGVTNLNVGTSIAPRDGNQERGPQEEIMVLGGVWLKLDRLSHRPSARNYRQGRISIIRNRDEEILKKTGAILESGTRNLKLLSVLHQIANPCFSKICQFASSEDEQFLHDLKNLDISNKLNTEFTAPAQDPPGVEPFFVRGRFLDTHTMQQSCAAFKRYVNDMLLKSAGVVKNQGLAGFLQDVSHFADQHAQLFSQFQKEFTLRQHQPFHNRF